MVAAGRDHSIAVTDKGRVVAWGEAQFGQVGGLRLSTAIG